MKDILGKALLDYQNGNYTEDITTSTNISDEDELPLPYLFREYSEMPKLEQKALQLCKGKVLDVGCGSGSHTLWLQNNGLTVKGIDVSKGALEVCTKRGVRHFENISILKETNTYDTVLVLMNGTGIFQELSQVSKYLKHLKSLLNPNGQILIDSSDISYMYDTYYSKRYFGELDYYLSYKGEQEEPLKWLYLDFDTLKSLCITNGLQCEKVMDGEHYDYLARITI